MDAGGTGYQLVEMAVPDDHLLWNQQYNLSAMISDSINHPSAIGMDPRHSLYDPIYRSWYAECVNDYMEKSFFFPNGTLVTERSENRIVNDGGHFQPVMTIAHSCARII